MRKSHDPAHWRQQAEECRKVAEQLDGASKAEMMEIAKGYDRLAVLAEAKVTDK